MGESAEDLRVQDNPAQSRYEALLGGDVAGYVIYDKQGNGFIFQHTLVEPAYEGKGVGGRLASGALDDVRKKGGSVVAECPFIAKYIERHPAYHDLLTSGGQA